MDAQHHLVRALAVRHAIQNRYGEFAVQGKFAIALLQLGKKPLARGYAARARAVFAKIKMENLVEMMDQVIAACEDLN